MASKPLTQQHCAVPTTEEIPRISVKTSSKIYNGRYINGKFTGHS